jgi:hypothetical protein
MLSSISSILQSKYPQALQRRKATVHRQLEFWTPPQNTSQKPPIWDNLNPQHRAPLITSLARLISKMVQPQDLNETQEDNHEQ